eukprot:4440781-Pyramimonas_sp.AAC.1
MGRADLSQSQRARLEVGNSTFHVTCRLIDACRKVGVPVFLEIPDRSLLWEAPRMLALRRSRDCVEARLDQCQFKAPWKKATRVVAWRSGCLSRLCHRCNASGRICSKSKVPHQELAGRAPGGRHWTSIAAAYPKPLCLAIARTMIDAAEYLRTSLLWSRFKP